jgi:hypothetical protein
MSMSYYRRVVKRRSACMTDEEIATLAAKAREHALDLAKANAVWKEPVLPTVILCWWCRQQHSPAEVDRCMAMQRPDVKSGQNGASSSSVRIGSLLSNFSEVWEFLTKSVYQDGKPRQTGSLSLRLASGGLQVTLTDPSSASFCTLTMESIDDALLAFEVGLKENSLPWRASNYSKPRK